MKKLIDKIQFLFKQLIVLSGNKTRAGWALPEAMESDEPNLDVAEDFRKRPYPGLHFYSEEREEYFYGRKKEKRSILEILEYYSLCFLIGKSGIGKSSLINAGLVPELRRRDFVPVMIRINFDHATDLLSQVKHTIVEELQKVDNKIPDFKGRTLWEYFQEEKLFNGFLKPVLILDQFEEIFTRGKDKQRELTVLLRELIDLSENLVPENVQNTYIDAGKTIPSDFRKDYRLIFVLREDYLPQLTGLRLYIPTLKYSIFRLEEMNKKQAFQAVFMPAQKAGIMDEETAWEIISKIPDSQNDEFEFSLIDEDSEKGVIAGDDGISRRIEPFLLNLFCYTLNEERLRKSNEGNLKIERSDVSKRNFDTLVRDYYEDVTEKRPGLSLAIEEELITPDGKYRKFSAKDNFKNAGSLSDDDIEYLIKNKLVRRKPINNLEYFELIHDILISVVSRKRKIRARTKRIVYSGLYLLIGMTVFWLFTWYKVNENNSKAEKQRISANLERATWRVDSISVKRKLDSIENATQRGKEQEAAEKIKHEFAEKNRQAEQKSELAEKEALKYQTGQLELEKKALQLTLDNQKSEQDRKAILVKQTQEQNKILSKIARSYAALLYAKSSRYYDEKEAVRNTLAVLAYDTLYGGMANVNEDSFNVEVYWALFWAADLTGEILPSLGTGNVSGYRKIDGVFNYSQPYYVCPFAGINDQNNNLLKDTNMVHAWISKKETRAARVLKIKKQVNRLVFSDIKGKSIHDTIELKKNEDVVSALFDPLEKVCVYSTRITVGDKSQPYNSGHVYLIELSDSRSKPVEIQTDQPEQFFFLDYGPSSSFLGVTNKGRVYEWKAFTTGLKPNFISQTPEPVVVSTIYTGPGTNNALFIGGENGKIFKWQPQQGMSAFFTKEGPRVTAISVSSNGKWIAAGNLFGDIQLWNMVIPQLPCINIYNGRKVNDALVSLHFSGNNNSLVKVSKDGYVYEIPLLMSSLVKRICDKQKFLEPKQWSTYIPNVSYKKLCQ